MSQEILRLLSAGESILVNGGGSPYYTPIGVYLLARDATFTEIFDSLEDGHLRYLCDGHIKDFILRHSRWLSTAHETFFLKKTCDDFVVVCVRLNVVEVSLPFLSNCIWRASGKYRLVVPRLLSK